MIFSFIFPLLFILVIGFLVITSFRLLQNKAFLYKIGFAYGIGVGCITVEMMLYSFLRVPWHTSFLLLPWVIIFLLNVFKKNISFSKKMTFTYSFDILDTVIFCGILITVGFVLLEVTLRPLTAFDAWANWFLTGKAYYLSGFIDPSYIHYANNSNGPILNLMLSFIYIIIGHINEQIGILFFSFFYIALLIVFYFSARAYMPRRQALLFTFLLASIENLIRHAGRFDVGYGDLPLGYFIYCSCVSILEFLKTKSLKTVVIYGLFITPAALIKSEGLPIFLITQTVLFILFSICRKSKISYVYFLGCSLCIIFTWYIFKHIFHLPENPFFQTNIKLFRIPIVFTYMLREFFNIGRWNFLWVGFLVSLFGMLKNKFVRILGVICLSQLFVYFIIYLMTPLPPVVHIQSSFDRLLLHLAPTAMLLVGLVLTSTRLENSKR